MRLTQLLLFLIGWRRMGVYIGIIKGLLGRRVKPYTALAIFFGLLVLLYYRRSLSGSKTTAQQSVPWPNLEDGNKH